MNQGTGGDMARFFSGMRRRKGNVFGKILPVDLSSLPYFGKFVADFHHERACGRAAEGKRRGEKGNNENNQKKKKHLCMKKPPGKSQAKVVFSSLPNAPCAAGGTQPRGARGAPMPSGARAGGGGGAQNASTRCIKRYKGYRGVPPSPPPPLSAAAHLLLGSARTSQALCQLPWRGGEASQQPCQKYALPTAAELNFHVVLCLPHKLKPHTPPHAYLRAETTSQETPRCSCRHGDGSIRMPRQRAARLGLGSLGQD